MKEPDIFKNTAFKPFCKKCRRLLSIKEIYTDSSGNIKCKICDTVIQK